MEVAHNKSILPHSLRRILTSSALVTGGRVAGAVLAISLQILLARSFGPENLGIFFLSLAVTSVLSVICALGYPIIVPKIVAEASELQNESWIKGFLRSAHRDVLLLSAIAAIPVGIYILSVPSLSYDLRVSLLIGVATAPVMALFRLTSALANAHRRFLTGYFPELVARPFFLLIVTLVMIQLISDLNIALIIAVNFSLVCAMTLWQFTRVRTLRSTDETLAQNTTPVVDAKQRKLWRHAALELSVAALFTAVFADLAILVAGLFLEQTNLGIFGTCLRVSFFVGFAIQAVHQICFRDMADDLQRKDRSALAATIARGNIIALVLSVGAFLAVLVLATPLLKLFGPQFVAGTSCLILLMLAQVLRALAGPATQLLALTGHQRTTVPVYLASVVLLGASGAALIPFYGLNGAALAVVITTAFWTFSLMFVAKRYEGINSATLRMHAG